MQGIPEFSGIIALSLALARVPLRWERIIAAGAALAVIIYFIRTLSFAVGLHTIASLLLAVVLITTATYVPPTKAFVVVSVSIITLAFMELILLKIFFALVKLEPQQVMSNVLYWKLLTLPQAVIMILIALMVPQFMKPEQGAWKL